MDGLKFAVVREDPLIEEAVLDRIGGRSALVVASGGCTALTLAARRDRHIAAFDINPVHPPMSAPSRRRRGRAERLHSTSATATRVR